MKNRRLILLSSAAGLLLISALLYAGFQNAPQDSAARRHLDGLLGQANANEPAPESAPTEPEGFPAFPSLPKPEANNNLFFGLPMPTTDIGMEETPGSYVLRIPLTAPEDSDAVRLNVTPHHIEVSGETGGKAEGRIMTSSFLQSFSTSQEVLPDQVRRQIKQNGDKTELVITIPKKAGTAANSTTDTPDLPDLDNGPNQQDSPPILQPPPENHANPLDTYSNRVI